MTTEVKTDLSDRLAVAEDRLILLRRWIEVAQAGYDALKTYGIDYQQTPEYKDIARLQHADRLPFKRGMQEVWVYWERVEHAIAAAIRRKQLRPV